MKKLNKLFLLSTPAMLLTPLVALSCAKEEKPAVQDESKTTTQNESKPAGQDNQKPGTQDESKPAGHKTVYETRIKTVNSDNYANSVTTLKKSMEKISKSNKYKDNKIVTEVKGYVDILNNEATEANISAANISIEKLGNLLIEEAKKDENYKDKISPDSEVLLGMKNKFSSGDKFIALYSDGFGRSIGRIILLSDEFKEFFNALKKIFDFVTAEPNEYGGQVSQHAHGATAKMTGDKYSITFMVGIKLGLDDSIKDIPLFSENTIIEISIA
ncbi:hypothetical protein [Mycoplasma tauri]|uniref:hypothetical protein n=1 Tax=Mycoplasma tauri TaxID=547987 RepID=UPI001CBE9DA0|nr:hypothetical protein [Mycoplasma tauri]MBZ4203775.1 hypothetical protein [Mycoplasma tauri]MBZ4212411.1 hypothetical protein [Mycoplasma tauri]